VRPRSEKPHLGRALAAFAFALAIAGALASAERDARAQTEPPKEETDPGALFRTATEALASDRPGDAIARFEALGDRGVIDAVVSYDRGLAYAARVRAGSEQPGDLGRAVHGFEEARALSEDRALVADASSALTAVRAEIARRKSRGGDPIELDTGVALGRSIVELMPENVWAALAALCSLALSIGIVVRARAEVRRAKVAGTTTASVAGGLLLLTSLILHSARDARLHLREAIVIAPTVRLLDDKRVAMTEVAPIPEGARVQLLDEGGDFARVTVGRVSGVLPSSALVPLAKR
jgi:hypothetical protein